ncbi:spore coat protein [Priestia megaterium]|uniref:spore coat protein n=1 Tax=Priestia megaterium TaxID=1404 RepID=UPI00207966FD|nr:spore coat protein [Priestia megaterium]USL27621.1 spore coat protein [Priestia megaterium]USL33594.1 spore coat protein [Priestia megaterium]
MSSRDYYYYDVKKKNMTIKKSHYEDDFYADHNEDDNNYNNSKFDTGVLQEADQVSIIDQESDELIWIEDSCDIVVHTTDNQVAVALQVAL